MSPPSIDRFNGRVHVGIAGQHDMRGIRRKLNGTNEGFDAVHTWHRHVTDNHLDIDISFQMIGRRRLIVSRHDVEVPVQQPPVDYQLFGNLVDKKDFLP